MSQVCSKCSRVNPPEAAYCYFDGAILAGHSANGGPVNAGTAPFPNQFVFPSGQVCHNFDQLALACQQNWKAAVDLLKQGFLAGFLGGLGRADLALAAQEAARFPDQDRGLDQLLAKLPSPVLEDPKLKAEPSELNLGRVPMGGDREIELHLTNLGMRLLYGSVVSDCKWLTLGDAPGSPQKLFQFGADTVIPVHIRGQHLRAGTKPLEGKLVVESNGGSTTVLVRVEVPVKPFPEGVLAGAISPRQVAEKALAQPKVAAPLFENGSVAKWFTDNGWIYPVQGPSASGLGAVQQFFEALGLAKAPKVTVSTPSLSLRGEVGQAVQATMEVKSEEKRPVYAYATCDQSWVSVDRARLNGRIATIRVRVPHVPNRPGEDLKANLHVTGNGNQRFVVPLILSVEGSPFAELTMAEPIALVENGGGEPVVPIVPGYAVGATATLEPAAVAAGAATATIAYPGPDAAPIAVGPPPTAGAAAGYTMPAPVLAAPGVQRVPVQFPAWFHAVPLAMLGLGLIAVLARDIAVSPRPQDNDLRIGLYFDYSANKKEREKLRLTDTFSFGLVKVSETNPKEYKRLMFDEWGKHNNTVVKIGNRPFVFGKITAGSWEERPAYLHRPRRGMKGTWRFPENILVTQTAEIIEGEPVEVAPGQYKQLLDTCLVTYKIENRGKRQNKVGLRLLLDTFIGDNDGPTFAVPGVNKLVDKKMDFINGSEQPVPDFVEALERPSLKNPGTVAHLGFRISDKLEMPDRVSLTHWPGPEKTALESFVVPLKNIETDSAIAIYWKEETILPGKARTLGFTFGLGNVSSGLTIGGNFAPNNELTVISLISEYKKGMTAELVLPEGFQSVKGELTQPVPEPVQQADGTYRPSPVTWRVRSTAAGDYTFEVKTSTNQTQTQKVSIKPNAIF